MVALVCLIWSVLAAPFKSKSRLEAENAALRHQMMVLRRQVRGRVRLTNFDRLFLVQLYRWCPSILQVLTIIQPETIVRWHRGILDLWRGICRSHLRDGDLRSPNRSAVSLTEWPLRVVDRLDPTRLSGPRHCVRRASSAPFAAGFHKLLHSEPNAPVIIQ